MQRIVTPIYHFIAHEVSGRAADPVATRVMYDDITECFWQRSMVDLLLPLPGKTRVNLIPYNANAGLGAAGRLFAPSSAAAIDFKRTPEPKNIDCV